MLTKRRLILDFLWRVDDQIAYGDEDGRSWMMGVLAWEDMGKPEKITVTVEAGDRLND